MTATADSHQITSVEQLRQLIGAPSELVPHKLWNELDESCMDFIKRSPFLLLATADAEGHQDCDPNGRGPAGRRVPRRGVVGVPFGQRRAEEPHCEAVQGRGDGDGTGAAVLLAEEAHDHNQGLQRRDEVEHHHVDDVGEPLARVQLEGSDAPGRKGVEAHGGGAGEDASCGRNVVDREARRISAGGQNVAAKLGDEGSGRSAAREVLASASSADWWTDG